MDDVFHAPIAVLLQNASGHLEHYIFPIVAVLLTFVLCGAIIGVVQQKLREAGSEKSIRLMPLFVSEMLSALCSGLRNIIPIALCALLLFALNDLLLLYKTVDDALSLQKQVKELQMVVKNLTRNTDIARITCTGMETGLDSNGGGRVSFGTAGGTTSSTRSTAGGIPTKHYRISILNSSGKETESEDITLDGNEIYVDFAVLNFDYSQISTGDRMNIAWPYRVYSERMAAKDGNQLKCEKGKDGIPAAFCLPYDEIYGLDADTYDKRIKQLSLIVSDDARRREAGIRSFIGDAIHILLLPGQSCILRVEGTGGISVLREDF